jgi:hypothetical protein
LKGPVRQKLGKIDNFAVVGNIESVLGSILFKMAVRDDGQLPHQGDRRPACPTQPTVPDF